MGVDDKDFLNRIPMRCDSARHTLTFNILDITEQDKTAFFEFLEVFLHENPQFSKGFSPVQMVQSADQDDVIIEGRESLRWFAKEINFPGSSLYLGGNEPSR